MTPEDQDRLAELQEHLIYNDPLYKDGFQAGAASRDAEIAALKTTPAHMRQDLHCVVSDIAQQVRDAEKENDQLREQVRMLREALLTCSAGDFSTGHVIYPRKVSTCRPKSSP